MNAEQIKAIIASMMRDWELMQSDGLWTCLEVNHTDKPQPVFMIHYGTIHSNGMYEAKLGSRSYYMAEDKVYYSVHGRV